MLGFSDTSKPDLQLKVCGMRDLENIAAIVALKPDWLGFIFYKPSSRFVGESLSQEVLTQIPETTKKVGVFVNENPDTILATVQQYQLDAVQLHGQESPIICRQLKNDQIIVIKAFSVDDSFDFNEVAPYENTCNYYLFDTKGVNHGGNGTTFNWEVLQRYPFSTPFFLSGGIGLEHSDEIKKLDLPLLKGIDINSRFEISPALKDTTKVKSFFNQIRK